MAPAILTVAIASAATPVFYPYLSPTDAYVYLAAGERLNSGHELYRLSPGDRTIASNPPFWDVPTLSPPLVGVIWRPLAMFGTTGMLIGWALTGVAFLAALAIIGLRAGLWAVIGITILAAPAGVQLGLGNINGWLAFGLVMVWLWRDRPAQLGWIVALLAMLKVTPLVLVLWIVATGRVRAFVWFAVASLVWLAISVAGAGWDAHWEYLRVIGHTSSVGTSELSLAGLARALGIPSEMARFAPWLALAVGAAAIAGLRRRADVIFALAVGLMVLGSPVVHSYWLAMLMVALTPFDRAAGLVPPGLSREHRRRAGSDSSDLNRAPSRIPAKFPRTLRTPRSQPPT